MNRDEARIEINRQSPAAFLQSARKTGYVCPECNNGTGKDGDGIVKDKKTGKYKCFKCGLGGDIFDLIGAAYGLSEFKDQFDKAAEIYGITVDKYKPDPAASNAKKKEQAVKTINEVATVPGNDISDYIAKCHANAGQTDYFAKRGITQESIDRFQLGFDPEFSENTGGYVWKAVIIPTSLQSYEARNTAVDPNSKTGEKNKYRKHGKACVFNLSALHEEKEKPIFICEGVFDAISIIQSGGQAVGLGSAVNYNLVINEIEKVMPSVQLVIAFDRDTAGCDNAEKFAEKLKEFGVPFMISSDIYGDYHDANDRLLKDPNGLKDAVAKTSEAAAAIPDPKEEASNEYINSSAGKSLKSFIDTIQLAANRPRLSTGFQKIDEALDGGIHTGLYIIGAISSLGKTTLTLQIADNLAQQGRDVLFFSLEQSKFDLMSKSISRETFLYCKKNNIDTRNAKSNLGILDGRRWADFDDEEKKVVNEAFKVYGNYAKHVFIVEGIGNISMNEIGESIRKHIAITGNARPIVIIDYLQIIAPSEKDQKSTDKQIVDHNVTALKRLSRDFDIPVIAISSLNRQNYSEKINMAAFKESGAIEYGSDVLIGLQLTGAGGKDFDVDKAKEENPRKIDFCVLKNRNGRTTAKGLPIVFYPVFNCFMSDENAGTDDGFTVLELTDEDNLPFD